MGCGGVWGVGGGWGGLVTSRSPPPHVCSVLSRFMLFCGRLTYWLGAWGVVRHRPVLAPITLLSSPGKHTRMSPLYRFKLLCIGFCICRSIYLLIVYTYIQTSIYMCLSECVPICVSMCICTCICLCTCTMYIYMYMYMCLCLLGYMHIYIYVHVYV